jgi:hypothetical protein
MGISDEKVVWVEALPEKVELAKNNGIHHILEGVIADENGRDVEFKVTNNVQSSSILNFGVLKK